MLQICWLRVYGSSLGAAAARRVLYLRSGAQSANPGEASMANALRYGNTEQRSIDAGIGQFRLEEQRSAAFEMNFVLIHMREHGVEKEMSAEHRPSVRLCAGSTLRPDGLASASIQSLEAAAARYSEALLHMGGNHPATQYYLGTCQLDAGRFAEGVANVGAAIKADPANFEEEAHQRLRAGRQGVEMLCNKPDPGSASEESIWGFDEGHGKLVQVWDDAIPDWLMARVAAAATAHQ
ncbi:hypothetical protein T484DRAFT_1782389, partial [Baffinella frigidus]